MVRAQTQAAETVEEPGVPKTPTADQPGAPRPTGTDTRNPIDTDTRIRIARPSRNLATAMRFYVEGLGLDVLWRTTDHTPGEHDLLMVGPHGGVWHFELTQEPERSLEPTPTVDDLFVVYLGEPVGEDLVSRLLAAGGTRVAAHNPYWDEHGVTVADPDGYRLVLCSRAWSD